jgi:hypothetical protein
MLDAMSHGHRHPLDVDLADYAGDLAGAVQREALEDHLSGCLLCRIKVRRLRDALGVSAHAGPGAQSGDTARDRGHGPGTGMSFPGLPLPRVNCTRPAPGQLWGAGNDERLLVLVLREEEDGRVSAAPVTFDAPAADDETIVVDAALSPFGLSVAVYPMLAADLPASLLGACFGQLAEARDLGTLLAGNLPGTTHGSAIDGPTDPRLEFRQMLADRLGALEEVAPDPDMAADAPPPRPEALASALGAGLRDRRGPACKLYRLNSWEGFPLPYALSWAPVATVDELGTVLVVFDTPSGLRIADDFSAAISVLARYNASALVVLSSLISPDAELFTAISLHNGIGVPSGQPSPPQPVLSGLAPADAIAKFLDQNSRLADAAWSARASAIASDVPGTLSRSVGTAISDVTDQGRRAKIAPKTEGYTSVGDFAADLYEVLRGALAGEPVSQRLADLADRGKR